MNDLHKLLTSGDVRKEGWDGFEESPNYPEGIGAGDLSQSSKSWRKTMMLIPAELVPGSQTSRRIVALGNSLDEYCVVYSPFRAGLCSGQPG